LAGLTDADEDAKRLMSLAATVPCKINLIPYNELGEDSQFHRPSRRRLERFYHILEEGGTAFTVRESRGGDIDAACGQLFHQQEQVGIEKLA